MDYDAFLTRLPGLYEDWGQPSARPHSPVSADVLSRVRGMTSPGVLQLLNLSLECLEPDESYCEVGCFQGATLIGALRDRPGVRAFAIDNFSEFDPRGDNRIRLHQNLEAFGLAAQVSFHEQSFEAFFLDRVPGAARFGVYFYDGAHDYRSQLMGLLLAVPFLADRALLVVDDANWGTVRQATWDFVAACPPCEVALDLPTPGVNHPSFWNGVMVLAWDRNMQHERGWPYFQTARCPDVIESLDTVQFFHMRRAGGKVTLSRSR